MVKKETQKERDVKYVESLSEAGAKIAKFVIHNPKRRALAILDIAKTLVDETLG